MYFRTGLAGGAQGPRASGRTRRRRPTGYSLGDSYEDVFDVGVSAYFKGKPARPTLQAAIGLGGGGVKAMIRHSVAALLNAAHPGVSYDLTVDQVIKLVQEAFAGIRTFSDAKDILAALNKQPHPL